MVRSDVERLKINPKELPEGLTRVETECESAVLEMPEGVVRLEGNVRVSLSLYRSSERVDVKGNLSFRYVLQCSRCLKDYGTDGAETVVLYCRKAESPSLDREMELTQEDVITYYYREGVIDLSCSVRDAILLSVPMKPLCRMDCKGLCPVCGKDLNDEGCSCTVETADPRWDALKKLKSQ